MRSNNFDVISNDELRKQLRYAHDAYCRLEVPVWDAVNRPIKLVLHRELHE